MRRGHAGMPGHIITVALFFGLALTWIAYILLQAGTIPTPGEKYTITATVPSANLLTPGARVTIAGAEVGAVDKVERAGDVDPNAKLTLQLTDDRVFPLPRDSTVEIRSRSQVGENYVSITVGKDAQTVPEGGSIGLQNADELVNIDQILSTLQGQTRQRARLMFQQLGVAIDDRAQELSGTLAGVEGLVQNGQATVETLQRDKEVTAQLVDQLGLVMSAVGDREAALETLARQGTASVKAMAARDAELSSILRELPSTLQQVQKTSLTLGTVSDTATPVVNELADATRALKPALQNLAPVADDAIPLVRAAGAARPSLDRLIDTAIPLGTEVPKAITPLKKLLCQVNPTLEYLNPRIEDTLSIVYGLGSGSNAYDATGHTIRLTAVEGENFVSGLPDDVLAAEHTLLQSGFLLPSRVTNWNPYPKIGGPGTDSAKGSGGHPANAAELKASGYKYPRIHADC